MHIHIFTLKHLKSLQNISILRSSSGSYTVPRKVTFLKTHCDFIIIIIIKYDF